VLFHLLSMTEPLNGDPYEDNKPLLGAFEHEDAADLDKRMVRPVELSVCPHLFPPCARPSESISVLWY
jgi:hypothetical protein